MSAKLAAQAPAWTPGTRHGYHPWMLGPYLSELIRRTDPAGRTPGRFFAVEIAEPLGLDFYIGLPASVDRDRVAHLHAWSVPQMLFHLHTLPPRFALAMMNPRSLTARSSKPPGVKVLDEFNREELRVVEMPAGNGIGTARSIAQLYGDAATGGSEIGLSSTTLEALKNHAVPPSNGLRDRLIHVDTSWSLGFLKPAQPNHLRLLRPRVRYSRNRRLIRIRRPRYRHRLRLRDEQNGSPPSQRSERTRPSPSTLPRCDRS